MVGKYNQRGMAVAGLFGALLHRLTAAGASVGLVAWLYEKGGFVTMLQTSAALCLLVICGADPAAEIKVPRRRRRPEPTRSLAAPCAGDGSRSASSRQRLAEVDNQEQRARYRECENQNRSDHDRTRFGEHLKLAKITTSQNVEQR